MSKEVQCRECGSTDATWHCFQTSPTGVQDGRLKMHDVHTIFVLGCNECAGDVRKVSGDIVAVWMTTANLSPEVSS